MPRAAQCLAGHSPLFWRADPSGRWTWSCHGWSAFTGLSEPGSRGQGWLEAVHPADRAAAAAPWVVGGASLERPPFRLKHRGGEDYREVRPYATHALHPDGTLHEWIGTLTVQARPLGVGRGCLDDVQHYMRNALAVIRSVARRTARTSDTVEHYATHFEGRLDAFARVQDALIRSGDDGVDLEGMIREELVAHRVTDPSVTVDGPHLRLRGRAAEAVMLALHELVINAVKFGALTSDRGAVSVVWTIDRSADPPRLLFRWSETGVRVAGPAPRRRGFGTDVIERSLPYELGAVTRLDFLPGEVRCSIALPLLPGIVVGDAA